MNTPFFVFLKGIYEIFVLGDEHCIFAYFYYIFRVIMMEMKSLEYMMIYRS